jgi:hypothetical protein
MVSSTRALLTGILDYAGTFPPASLPLAEAVSNYARVWGSGDRWILGRLIVPFHSLGEFDQLARTWEVDENGAWSVSVVLGPQAATHLSEALALAERRNPRYRIASLEFPPLGAADIRDFSRSVPDTIEMFFEVPIESDLERCINVISASGAFAKVRTGGVTTSAFPTPERLVRFFEAFADAGLAFKATAGLHHAIRGCYALTYEPGSQTETMHGFMNVAVAAAIVCAGGDSSEAVEALSESSAQAFELGPEALTWRARTIGSDNLAAMRRRFFKSFGSCSVREPIAELAELRLS